jgi:hypothetical protein
MTGPAFTAFGCGFGKGRLGLYFGCGAGLDGSTADELVVPDVAVPGGVVWVDGRGGKVPNAGGLVGVPCMLV